METPSMALCRAKVECRQFTDCKYIEYHMGWSDMFDEDGYPTDEALEIVERWGYYNKKELFEFIKGLWNFREWGWHETADAEKTVYEISTGGWSGNESIIYALEHNHWLNWGMTWVQSRRGGHYIFEVKHDDL